MGGGEGGYPSLIILLLIKLIKNISVYNLFHFQKLKKNHFDCTSRESLDFHLFATLLHLV
jgi:hypothetical protein